MEEPFNDESCTVYKSLANSHGCREVETTARMANSHSRDRLQEMREKLKGHFLVSHEILSIFLGEVMSNMVPKNVVYWWDAHFRFSSQADFFPSAGLKTREQPCKWNISEHKVIQQFQGLAYSFLGQGRICLTTGSWQVR